MIESTILQLLIILAVPEVGLLSVFIISLISATLIPMGSEPAVFAVVKANGDLFWPVIMVATIGNTLGGMIDYWMGFGANLVLAKDKKSRSFVLLTRFGPKSMLLAWLPIVGDPICTLAGWMRFPFWPSVFYMATGKFLRYLTLTSLLLTVPDGCWYKIAHYLS